MKKEFWQKNTSNKGENYKENNGNELTGLRSLQSDETSKNPGQSSKHVTALVRQKQTKRLSWRLF